MRTELRRALYSARRNSSTHFLDVFPTIFLVFRAVRDALKCGTAENVARPNARLGSEGRAKILHSLDGVHRPRCGEGAGPGGQSGGAVEEILRTLKYYPTALQASPATVPWVVE